MNDDTPAAEGPEQHFAAIEAAYMKTIPEWKQIIRSTPGFGGGDVTHPELVKILENDYGMDHVHADALVAHAFAEDRS